MVPRQGGSQIGRRWGSLRCSVGIGPHATRQQQERGPLEIVCPGIRIDHTDVGRRQFAGRQPDRRNHGRSSGIVLRNGRRGGRSVDGRRREETKLMLQPAAARRGENGKHEQGDPSERIGPARGTRRTQRIACRHSSSIKVARHCRPAARSALATAARQLSRAI